MLITLIILKIQIVYNVKKKDELIKDMQAQINMLKCVLNDMQNNDNTIDICEQFINTDVLVKQILACPIYMHLMLCMTTCTID